MRIELTLSRVLALSSVVIRHPREHATTAATLGPHRRIVKRIVSVKKPLMAPRRPIQMFCGCIALTAVKFKLPCMFSRLVEK